MDVNLVLEGTLSPDATIRGNAEEQLTQAANANFSLYVSTLVQQLASDSAPKQIRQAAGLALKNSFSAREYTRLKEVQEKWLSKVDEDTKAGVKQLALQTLASNDAAAGQAAAQVIASIAAIDLPRAAWPELMPTLVKNVGEGADHLKQASLTTIGFICETQDADLRRSLEQHSNAILTAVVQGARKEEPNEDVRLAAISALGDSLEFVNQNFKNEGERNYIMQVVCEATQASDSRIQEGAFGCLNRIMAVYYEHMRFYMEKALFGLTIMGMKSEDEDVAKLAVEFWSTVCEEEIAIEDDNAQVETQEQMRQYFNFARVATPEVVPVLLNLLTKQDPDAPEDEYNISRAAYNCLQLYAQAVQGVIIPQVLQFVEANLRQADWHDREAAVSAFGAIMEGPDENVLDPIVKQALPVLIDMMTDEVLMVRDSAAYALGRICECCSGSIDPALHLQPLISSLFNGLANNPKMAASCCWALMNLAERFCGDIGCQENPISPHFNESVRLLLQLTERPDTDSQLRMAAYEVLNTFVTNAAQDCLPAIQDLAGVIVQRLEDTIPLQAQIVSMDDRRTLQEIQTSLSSAITAITHRLEGEIAPQADRIMHVLLQLLQTTGPKSSVPDTVFGAISAIANATEEAFAKYMDAFAPFLFAALGNQEEASLCSMAIGLVTDVVRNLGPQAIPYCDNIMNHLLNNLKSSALANQFKPAILTAFGDIAGAIGGDFEKYLSVVGGVLQQAGNVPANADGSYEMYEYVMSLREGIMDAWQGIIAAMKQGNKLQLLQSYVESIFQLLNAIYVQDTRSEGLLRSAMGVLGDIGDAFPNGEFAEMYRGEWVLAMIRDVKSNRDFSDRTIELAKWARQQLKRQVELVSGNNQS